RPWTLKKVLGLHRWSASSLKSHLRCLCGVGVGVASGSSVSVSSGVSVGVGVGVGVGLGLGVGKAPAAGDRVATSTVARDPAATSIAVLQLGPRRAGAAVPDGELTFTVTFLSAGTVRCSHSTQAPTGRHADTSLSVVRKDFSSE